MAGSGNGPPVTEPLVTDSPVTAPVTEPSMTKHPVTAPPRQPSMTDLPVTEAPVTEPPNPMLFVILI